MQATQPRPVTPANVPMSSPMAAATTFMPARPLMEAKRVDRDGVRFGPRAGEVYADEAKFGSFS